MPTSQVQLLDKTSRLLERLHVAYMVVGSHASSFYGEPRTTHDIDMSVSLTPSAIEPLIQSIDPAELYLSESALREGRMANLIELRTGEKVDLFLANNQVASIELGRRRPAMILGVSTMVSSPEDLILAKLRWNQLLGGSEQQMRDIRQVLIRQKDRLDWHWIRSGVQRDNTQSDWDLLQREVEE